MMNAGAALREDPVAVLLTLDEDTLICTGLGGLTESVAAWARKFGADVSQAGDALTIRGPAAAIRQWLAYEIRALGILVNERDGNCWPVVTLDASGPFGIKLRATTVAGMVVIERLRASLDAATAERSGGPVGSLMVGCLREGKETLVHELVRWLAAQGAAVRRAEPVHAPHGAAVTATREFGVGE